MRALHWFRSNLRLTDNTALAVAAMRASQLGFLFLLDDALLTSADAPMLCPGYPPPIVDHGERRRLAIACFEEARRDAARV